MTTFTKVFLSLAVMLSLTACGAGIEASLPDDPTNEPAAVEAPAVDDSQSQEVSGQVDLPSISVSEQDTVLSQYNHLDPLHAVPTAALQAAVLYFHKNKSSFKNQNVISVLDFSKKSTTKRWHFINMKTGAVWSVHVAHGKGSDADHDGYAEKFSNTSGSNASSLGFYRTAETYQGSNGFSLRLDGLSSTNSNARARAVVVHGANYVQDTSIIQGRSWGCPAVSQENRDKVINMIKGGSLLYAFK